MDSHNKKSKKISSFLLSLIVILNIYIVYVYGKNIPQNQNENITTSTNIKKDKKKLYVGGEPLGIRINTKGVLVVGLSDIDTENGTKTSPAVKSGISIGDTILKVKDEKIKSGEHLSYIIDANKDKEISILVEHKGTIIKKNVKPIKSKHDDKYKIGLWVRDSTSGIGTMTFYDAETGKYGALGHGISDIDTGSIITVSSGEIVPSKILSIKKSLEGEPGELKGIFCGDKKPIGTIEKNTIAGVYGKFKEIPRKNKKFKEPLEIAYRNELKEGKAYIYTTIDGEKPDLYEIEIEKLLYQREKSSKSMVIKITDKRLLEKTGGIVQGMSGSPIIQNNKIVGAVTHVLVNKPNKGYGIYIEWMLQECESY